MKLVDTVAEQELLERMLEETKPPVPAECRHLHYLLFTPFRYGAPYPLGSRFRRAGFTPGVFYASETAATAIAELTFHRLLFFADSPGTPWPSTAGEYTAFSVSYRWRAVLDLTTPPLSADRARWTHRTDYSACQAVADEARRAGREVLRYESVRDAAAPGGINLAILTCHAFASPAPRARQTWRIYFSAAGARAICAAPVQARDFPRGAFSDDPRIAALAWER